MMSALVVSLFLRRRLNSVNYFLFQIALFSVLLITQCLCRKKQGHSAISSIFKAPKKIKCQIYVMKIRTSKSLLCLTQRLTMFQNIAKIVGKSVKQEKQRQLNFFQAIAVEDHDSIREALDDGVDINSLNSHDITALHMVAEKGDLATAKLLLSYKGIDVNQHRETQNNDTALDFAVYYNHPQLVSILLNRGADPNIINHFGKNSLHIAVRKRNATIIRNLLSHKVQINVEDIFGNTPLSLSMIEYPSENIAEGLLKLGADPNFCTLRIPLLLELALNVKSTQNLEMVKMLLAHGANLNITAPVSKKTALHMAAITGYVPLTNLLLLHGANVNLRDVVGRTPYDIALDHEHKDLLSFYNERERLLNEAVSRASIKPQSSDSMKHHPQRNVRFSENRVVDESHDTLIENLSL